MFHYLFRISKSGENMYITESVTNTLLTVIHALVSSSMDFFHKKQAFPEIINDVINYLDQHYDRKISLEELSSRFYISPHYLSRKFKKHTGYSISQYLINRRMGEAERMLVFDHYSIRETAARCGYTDLQYFYKTFKKYTGCTPVEFVKKYK